LLARGLMRATFGTGIAASSRPRSFESDPLPGPSPQRPPRVTRESAVHRMRHGNEGESRTIPVEHSARRTRVALELESGLGHVRSIAIVAGIEEHSNPARRGEPEKQARGLKRGKYVRSGW